MSANVEAEFDAVVAALGGRRVSEYVGKAPPFDNADYIFPDHKVIAELKCLDEDKMADERIIEKASQLYEVELSCGRAPVVIFGEMRFTTEGFSEDFTRSIIGLYRAPVQALVKKANKQIKATKEHLHLDDHIGLLVVANNRHSALDPIHGAQLVGELLDQQTMYRGINAAVYLSADQRVVDPRSGPDVSCWVDMNRAHLPAPSDTFLSALKSAWYQRVIQRRGLTGIADINVDEARFADLTNDPATAVGRTRV